MSQVNSAASAAQPKRQGVRTLQALCATLAFAAAMGGADASAQGVLARVIAARAQTQANTANVVQTGANNGAAVSQQGRGNGASLTQNGNDNTATLHQNGDYNSARLVQMGDGNTIDAMQLNNGNVLCVVQRGDNLNLATVQTGGDRAYIVQNHNRTRVVTNRVPRPCRTDRVTPNPHRGSWR
jgi:hypothetical protein